MHVQIPKTASVLLEFFIKRESKVSLLRDPLSHFCQEEVVLHAQEFLLKLNKQVITYQDVRDMVENLVALHNLVSNQACSNALARTRSAQSEVKLDAANVPETSLALVARCCALAADE